ncbi:MAG: ABC transporter ATP-binding protein [Patescibacteria group bacterium]
MSSRAVAIEVKELRKHFGSFTALEGTTFNVSKGDIFGFLGPNGAGKTTTIRCLMDFIRADGGSAKILGLDSEQDSVQLKRKIGYLPASEQYYENWSGQEHIEFVAKLRGVKPSSPLIKQLGFNPNSKVKHLSTGNRQKLGIILAFLGNPEVLIMDEPTRGLDPILQNQVYEILTEHKSKGGTVFMSSHNLPEVAKICDSVAVIREGAIVAEETIESLRNKSVHHIDVTFEKPFVDHKTLEGNGVKIAHSSKYGVSLRVKGDLNRTLRLITKQPVKDLEVTHASLEEIFLEIYK